MQITIKTSASEVTGDVKALLEEKFSTVGKLVPDEALLDCEIERSVAVERSGNKYRAEGNLSVNGELYRAEAEGATLEAAVDEVRDELARVVKRAKGKERSMFRRGGAALKRMLRRG